MARSKKKHQVRVLQTSPLGRPGQVIEVTEDTPNVDRWLTLGVLEYVKDEEAGDEGQGDDGPEGAGEAEPEGVEVLDPQAG